ncbi:MAG TPA: DinB family protein [Niabella sp.]
MKAVADQLDAILHQYYEALLHIGDGVTVQPAPGKWSKMEIMGHLIDSAQNNIQRFIRVQYESEVGISYNQDAWVKAQHYNQWPPDDLIQLWRLLNKQVSIILKNFPEERKNARVAMGREKWTAEAIAQDYIRHLIHHLNQIIS